MFSHKLIAQRTVVALLIAGGCLAIVAEVRAACDPASLAKLTPANVKPASVLSQLDLNKDGVPDGSPDPDGDGLPDSWEQNVSIFAPTAIGPGTPSTFLTSRLLVSTDPCKADSDGDGLTDFDEVFGLKFIDDNRNGKLDFIFTDTSADGKWQPGEPIDGRSEWLDLNNDGMPSIGERPFENLYGVQDAAGKPLIYWIDDNNGDGIPDTIRYAVGGVTQVLASTSPRGHAGLQLPTRVVLNGQATDVLVRSYDFDGFMFTDPRSADTDGDGLNDGDDADPLINPATFGLEASALTLSGAGDSDGDGLGNPSDFGNDVGDASGPLVDNPLEIASLVNLFRKDRIAKLTIPESLIEDMIGADWNGDGFFRITDVRQFTRLQQGSIDCLASSAPPDLVNETLTLLFNAGPVNVIKLYGQTVVPGACTLASNDQVGIGSDDVGVPTDYGVKRQGLGLQTILLSFAKTLPPAMPDVRVWTILYAWRVPGFDIDGDGFIGSPENNFLVDDRHRFLNSDTVNQPRLDGKVTSPLACGSGIVGSSAAAMLGLVSLRLIGASRRRRSA